MVNLIHGKVVVKNGQIVQNVKGDDLYKNTLSYSILSSHNVGPAERGKPLNLKFDALASHDITYVGIIQTAKASGLKMFPVPYVLTNCHNSLCAVGGTINEDDHVFGLSCAKKYGGIFVPPHLAVIHTYMREAFAAPRKMILGSDSHTRYGALGTLAIGEGGGELAKQLLSKTYDIKYPDVIGVKLTGKVRAGVGPQDVSLALIKAVFECGFVNNKILEFFGEGIANLPIEFRNGIDVMTTETTCLSSVWVTDTKVLEYLKSHNRASEYKELKQPEVCEYDGLIEIDLGKIECMIALPFHPSNVYTIKELNANAKEILSKIGTLSTKIHNGKIRIDQAVIAGCAGGTFDNIAVASDILCGKSVGDTVNMSVYCGSQPIYLDLLKRGYLAELTQSGAVVKTSFCGPCFGAGDVPQNNGLSIRHTTRNFESREGSRPADGQIAYVALMDARSIAATVANGGYLTPATDVDFKEKPAEAHFDDTVYKNRVYNGYLRPKADEPLIYGPNIADWPVMPALPSNLIMQMSAVITDPVTTTDELIPSGETSSYRSNPLRLAEFTLSRKCPDYVKNAKNIDKHKAMEVAKQVGLSEGDYGVGSVIFANKPGDGSAREQAASCQRVLGGVANIAVQYATKRYRSNLINWGMLPLLTEKNVFQVHDFVVIKDTAKLLSSLTTTATVVRLGQKPFDITLKMEPLTSDELKIVKAGCLINFNREE